VFVHDSDAIPGRVSLWAGKFAERIAVSYAEAAEYFPKKNAVLTGIPIRREVMTPTKEGAFEFLKLESNIPTLLVIGGSQGAQKINEVILQALPELLNTYQIIHQTGKANIKGTEATASVILENHPHRSRYRTYDYLSPLATKMAAGAAQLVVSRAGSTAIAEIASWGLPSIVIPLPEKISRDQRKNAYAYARDGASIVVEEHNLSPNLVQSEIGRILNDSLAVETMKTAAKAFAHPNAAKDIARELIEIALKHED